MAGKAGKEERTEDRLNRVEAGYRAVLEFLEKMEELNQFQERIDLMADVSQIWEAFLGDLRGLIRTEICALFLVDDDTGEFRLVHVSPEGSGPLCEEELRLQVECGVFPWILNRRRPGVVPSLAFKEERSVILLPLTSPRRILGMAMVLAAIEETAITHESIKLLTLLTRQCSLVMENSLLYQKLQEEQRSLIQAQAQVLQAERLASIGRLTAGASHEILNPLHIILGYLQILEKDQHLDNGHRRYVDIMKRQTDRISRIVKSLIQFSQQEAVQKKRLDIHGILEKAVALMTHQGDIRNIRLEKDLAGDLPWIWGNEETLMQAFHNILTNAREAMPDGGVLRIVTRVLKAGEGPAVPGGQVEVAFHDTGRGIPPEERARIFDPFYTSKDRASAPGLGLSIAYGIIRDHGGTITVASEINKGSVFTVRLPVGVVKKGGGAEAG